LLPALELLPRLTRAILRHLFAYGELLYEEACLAVANMRRRIVGLAVALLAGMMTVGLGCLWVIAATWDGPNRLWAVGGLCIGFLLIAIIGGAYAVGGRPRGAAFEHLRAQWRADLQEIARLDPALTGEPGAAAMGGQGAGAE
jgi:uncharacterized membrane protein YqjE